MSGFDLGVSRTLSPLHLWESRSLWRLWRFWVTDLKVLMRRTAAVGPINKTFNILCSSSSVPLLWSRLPDIHRNEFHSTGRLSVFSPSEHGEARWLHFSRMLGGFILFFPLLFCSVAQKNFHQSSSHLTHWRGASPSCCLSTGSLKFLLREHVFRYPVFGTQSVSFRTSPKLQSWNYYSIEHMSQFLCFTANHKNVDEENNWYKISCSVLQSPLVLLGMCTSS